MTAMLATLASIMVPSLASATTNPFGNGSAWSVPIRYMSSLAPHPNGGIIANTAIANGGVPTGGDGLVGVGVDGTVGWRTPYQDQGINENLVMDATGNTYHMEYLSSGEIRLVAMNGANVRWSKSFGDGVSRLLVTGADGNLYALTGNRVVGYAASDGHELFTSATLESFASGSYDRIFAYDHGLVAYSGYGKVVYLDYTGRVVGGPYTYAVPAESVFERSTAASATGDLFAVWYTQGLTPDGCLDAAGQTVLAKFTPSGMAWTKTLPHVSRCNHGGPYVNALPGGGAVVSSVADAGIDLQYMSGSGEAVWHQAVGSPTLAGGVTTGIRGLESVHVDGSGQTLAAMTFIYECGLRSDYCAGVELVRLAADGAPQQPILLAGDPVVGQQSWAMWGTAALTLVPGKAAVSLRHHDGGFVYGAISYSVDAFTVPGLVGEYPQYALWGAGSGGSPTPSPTPTSKLRIASLGDSVASAEGTRYRWHYVLDPGKNNGKNGVWNGKWVADELHPTWEPTNDNTPAVQDCHRSTDGYPYKVAATLKAELFNVSCSGATAANGILRRQVFADRQQAAGPQLGIKQNLYDPPNGDYDKFKPDVVTLTLGADDVEFADVVKECYTSAFNAGGASRFCDKRPVLNAKVDALLIKQKTNLEKVISEIIRRGKAAGKVPLIVVTTYYDPFPTKFAQCQDIIPIGNALGLSQGEMGWLRDKLNLLNQNIRSVVANHPEVALVDLQDVMSGHRWCDKDPWIFGPSISTQPGQRDNPSPFHPSFYGQTVIGDRTTAVIKQRLHL